MYKRTYFVEVGTTHHATRNYFVDTAEISSELLLRSHDLLGFLDKKCDLPKSGRISRSSRIETRKSACVAAGCNSETSNSLSFILSPHIFHSSFVVLYFFSEGSPCSCQPQLGSFQLPLSLFPYAFFLSSFVVLFSRKRESVRLPAGCEPPAADMV